MGNKADLEEKREVSYEEGQETARELGALFCEVSAREATNITQMLNQACSFQALERKSKEKEEEGKAIRI